MKKFFCCAMAAAAISFNIRAEVYTLQSPDGDYEMCIDAGDGATAYSLRYKGKQVVEPSAVGLKVREAEAVGAGKVTSVQRASRDSAVNVAIGKNSTIADRYNELTLNYDNGLYSLAARAYPQGVAYRWRLNFPDSLTVADEIFNASFGGGPVEALFPQCEMQSWKERDSRGNEYLINQAYRNFERAYIHYDSIAAIPDDAISVTPAMFTLPGSRTRIAITEANVYDYPGLYLMAANPNNPNNSNNPKLPEAIAGHWAAYPKEVIDPDNCYSTHLVISREDYIAHVEGKRELPWRVIIAADRDAALLNNGMVYLLADECEIADTSWIKPGASAWEWWHKAVLDGVDFPSGNHNLSLQLYKYYVDWAARNGVPYMTLDAGWSEDYIRELCGYAAQRGVGIIVWTWISCPRQAPFDWVKKMKDYGVAGAKIDFFERNDQEAMRWQRDMARRLADEQMVALYHGCPVPSGLERTFPNIMGYEASRGQECNFWDWTISPRHHLTLPFTRNLVGPHDFTPGSLRQVTESGFQPRDIDNTPPMSRGTVMHEMALFITLDGWIASLCDSPTEYDKYPELKQFVTSVPTTWDETLPLDGVLGEHILMAKRKGEQWYVVATTADAPHSCELPLDFLTPGVSYDMLMLSDAPDVAVSPRHYTATRATVTPGETLSLPLSLPAAGGTVIILTPN